MIQWIRQGAAWVGPVTCVDGVPGTLVLVAGRENAKGAVLMVSELSGGQQTFVLPMGAQRLQGWDYLEALCMQERVYGSAGLPDVEETG